MSRMPIRCRNRFLWPQGHAAPRHYAVLDGISPDYPPATGRSHTRYSPVRRSPAARIAPRPDAPRLACVRPVASVHPEPGSNSSLYSFLFLYYTFEALPDRIDFFLSYFLYYTCFFNSFNELGKSPPGRAPFPLLRLQS